MKKVISIFLLGWDVTSVVKTTIVYNKQNISRLNAIYHDEEYSEYKLKINEHPILGKNSYTLINEGGKIVFKLHLGGKIAIKLVLLCLIQLPLFHFQNLSEIWILFLLQVYLFCNGLTYLNQCKNEQIIKIIICKTDYLKSDEI